MANLVTALAFLHPSLPARCTRASELAVNLQSPEFISLEIPRILPWRHGLERGEIAEIIGPRSSGRTTCLLHVLAAATREGAICAIVDTNNQFDPASAERNGVLLSNLLWVRCDGQIDHAIRSADLLLHAGGFGIVALDLCETNPRLLNKIPLSYWFRFRRAIAHTPSILLTVAESKQANSSFVNRLTTKQKVPHWLGEVGFRHLHSLRISTEVQRTAAVLSEPLVLTG
jgi:RecA/RadA recombinase